MADDVELLRQYALTGDAAALADVVARYRDFVYGVCLRVHRDQHAAEESTQECFLRLMQRAGSVERSLGGWLHRCATRIALDAIRSERARRRRERAWVACNTVSDAEAWAAISPLVDEALEALPERLRHVVIEHLLRQRPQVELAAELGVSPATVSRRLEQGLQRLRAHLRKAGVIAPLLLLGTSLRAHAPATAPTVLTAELGKMALAGIGAPSAAVGVATGALGKILLVALLLAGAVGLLLLPSDRHMEADRSVDPPRDIHPPTTKEMPTMSDSEAPRSSDADRNRQDPIVNREGDRVWVDGVPVDAVDHLGHWDMLLRGIRLLLVHRGEEIELDELMAFAGDAFHLCYGEHWHGMTSMMIPTDTLANACAAYGYEGEWFFWRRGDEHPSLQDYTDALLPRIRSQIDAGRPVMIGGCADQGCQGWSVVVGYDREATRFCHVGIGEPYRWVGIRGLAIDLDPENYPGGWNGRLRGRIGGRTGGWLCDLGYLLGERTTRPTERDRRLRALHRAVELFQAPRFHMSGAGGIDYHYGEEAYRRWAGALRELDFPADLEAPQPSRAHDWYDMGVLDLLVDQVVRGRGAAAAFCEHSGELLPTAAEPLAEAARCYREEVALAREVFADFMPMYDGDDEPRVAWLSDPQRRAAGAAAVERMLERERAAIAAIGRALTTLEGDD